MNNFLTFVTKSCTEEAKENSFCNTKHNSKTAELEKEIIRHRMSKRFVDSNDVIGFQGYCFINEAGMFLTSVEMSVDWKRQTLRDMKPCFSTCLSVKGAESQKVTVLQTKRYKSLSLQMWAPRKSVVVRPPDLEVKGTCLAHENNRRRVTVGLILPSELKFSGEQSSSLVKEEISVEGEKCSQEKHDGENFGIEGKMLLALVESSLKKKLNSEYIDIIPNRLIRSAPEYKSPQFGNSSTTFSCFSPRLAIKGEILPTELKFGIQNHRKLNSTSAFKRSEGDRLKIGASFCRGKLEPLLPRKKPAKNLHKELEREEARARRKIQFK